MRILDIAFRNLWISKSKSVYVGETEGLPWLIALGLSTKRVLSIGTTIVRLAGRVGLGSG